MINTGDPSIQALKNTDRKNTVLIFGATGINFWYYYPLVRQFSLEELKEFKAVYGISGGAASYWLYCLARRNHSYEDRVSQFDILMRQKLNRYGIIKKLGRLIKNEYIYSGSDLLSLMSEFVSPEAMEYTFHDFEMENYHVLGHDFHSNQLIVFSRENTPGIPIAHAIAGSVFPRRIGNKMFCRGTEEYPYISDIEFADKKLKRNFFNSINEHYRGNNIFYFNLYKTEKKDNINKIKVPRTRYPNKEQITDLLLAFFNLPNSRYKKVFYLDYQ